MVQFDGIAQIEETFDKLADGEQFQQAMETAVAMVERAAKEKARVKTGALRRSITSEVSNTGDSIEGIVFTPLEYAPYIEYGTGLFAENGGRKKGWAYRNEKDELIFTRGSHPYPFMRPALDENREEIVKLMQEAIKDD